MIVLPVRRGQPRDQTSTTRQPARARRHRSPTRARLDPQSATSRATIDKHREQEQHDQRHRDVHRAGAGDDTTSGGATSITLLRRRGHRATATSTSASTAHAAQIAVDTYSSTAQYDAAEYTITGLNPLTQNTVTMHGHRHQATAHTGGGADIVEIDGFSYTRRRRC